MTVQDERRISRLTRETLALILAGGQGSRLYEPVSYTHLTLPTKA